MRLIRKGLLLTSFLLTILHGLVVHSHYLSDHSLQLRNSQHVHLSFFGFARHLIEKDLGGDHLENFISFEHVSIGSQSSHQDLVPIFANHFFDYIEQELVPKYPFAFETQGTQLRFLRQISFRGPPVLS